MSETTTAAEYGFDTPAPTTLVVAVRDGRVTVTATDTATSTVHVTGPRAGEARVEQRGGRILVIGPKPRGFFGATDLHYDIKVPSDSQLVVRSGSAQVVASGRLGTARVKTASGDIALDGLSGAGVVDTGSGDISIGDAEAALRVRSGSGAVRIGSTGQGVVSTGSGDVGVDRVVGKLVVKSGSGDLEIGEAQGDVVFTTGSGSTVVGCSRGGRIASKAASGDVRIGVAAGVAVWTDVSTVSGRLSSDLPRMGEPERGAPYVEIRATTVSGDIALTSV
jgi:hypothetical protein